MQIICNVLMSQCDGCGCFDEHINLKSGIMGLPHSVSTLFLYLVCVMLHREKS